MNTLRFVIIFCALPWALGAQSGFGALYPATSGFTGRDVWVRDYEYRVYADQFDAATSTFTRIDMETGLDGTYWGFSGHTYAVPFGGRIVVDRGGDYVTAETFEAAPEVQKLRLSERQMNGQLVSLLDYTFPEVVSISIDQFVLPVPYGDYFVAGSYRRAAAPHCQRQHHRQYADQQRLSPPCHISSLPLQPQNHPHRLQQDQCVQIQAGMAHIIQIVFQFDARVLH